MSEDHFGTEEQAGGDEYAGTDAEARQAVWIRGLFMILFMVVGNIAAWLIAAVAVFQFLFVIITGKQNPQLASFGEGLSRFIYQIAKFLTFGIEEKPFPFTDWPGAAPRGQ
jgi:Domain of unknown function (DUF4389)